METVATDVMVPALLQMVEMSRDGLALLDEEYRFVYASPAACVFLGSSSEELVGRDSLLCFPPCERMAIAEELGSDEPARWCSVLSVDGTDRAIEYEARPHVTDKGTLWILALRDVTGEQSERASLQEQRRKEEQWEQEEEYRAIFESTIDGLVILDMEGTIVEANAAFCEILGYTRDELIGLNAVVLTPPEALPRLAEAMLLAAEEGHIPHNAADKSMRKDGSLLDVETRGRTFTYKGRPHVLAVVRDITERVRAEEELRKKEAEYRGVFESTGDGLIIGDAEGVVVEVNPAACQLYGYSHDEFVGLSLSRLIHQDYRHRGVEQARTIETGGTVQVKEIALRKDGTSFHAEVRGTRFMYRGQPMRLAIVRDISERLEAEEKLREREEQYRSIFEATSDGLGVLDMEGHIVEVNPAFCQMYGYSRDEVIGLRALALMHPDYHHLLAEGMQSIQTGNPVQVRSVSVRKDGTLFHVDGRGATFLFNGKPHILGMSRDITEQTQAEEELREREAEYGGSL